MSAKKLFNGKDFSLKSTGDLRKYVSQVNVICRVARRFDISTYRREETDIYTERDIDDGCFLYQKNRFIQGGSPLDNQYDFLTILEEITGLRSPEFQEMTIGNKSRQAKVYSNRIVVGCETYQVSELEAMLAKAKELESGT